jgi:hypothetical protein
MKDLYCKLHPQQGGHLPYIFNSKRLFSHFTFATLKDLVNDLAYLYMVGWFYYKLLLEILHCMFIDKNYLF